MKKIFPLSPDIIAKIAAGEVIERPAYAVKELIENALDAHADSISIHIEESGLRRIIVVDNGVGMSKEDLLDSFKLHTTSKITSIDQLDHIDTLGFRGEALASIAAISNLTIQSRTKKSSGGTEIVIKNGKVEKTSPVGMPFGTTVTVGNLFHSVPGRKKFLKSLQTEFRHILTVTSNVALAHPEVAFKLVHNKKLIFDLPITKKVEERIGILLGAKIISSALPIDYQKNYLSISGFIAKPQQNSSIPNKQFLFINGRSVTDKLLASIVKNAYGTLLAANKYPVFVLSLTLPFEHVDVNVHPRKEHVRFANGQELLDEVHTAIAQTLTENNLTNFAEESLGFSLDDTNLTSSFAGRVLKEQKLPWDLRVMAESVPTEILQLHNLYLITHTRFGLLVVDQHAAHERILYEDFSKMLQQQKQESPHFVLSKPQLLELSVSEKALIEEYLPVLASLGFVIEPFKDTTFLLQSVPLLFQDRKPQELVMELLEDLSEKGKTKSVDAVSKKLIAYLACRGAVKAGEQLSKKQMAELLTKLEATENNATCPHGRPTKIIIDLDQLHRMFKRK